MHSFQQLKPCRHIPWLIEHELEVSPGLAPWLGTLKQARHTSVKLYPGALDVLNLSKIEELLCAGLTAI